MKKKKQEIEEPTFGYLMTPVLDEIAGQILERKDGNRHEIPLYGDEAIPSAMIIFSDVILDKAFRYWIRLGLTEEQMKQNATRLGDELRLIALRYADYDTLKRK